MELKVIFGEHFLEDQSGFLVPFRDDPINVNGIYRHRPSVVPMEKWVRLNMGWTTWTIVTGANEYSPSLKKILEKRAAAPFLDKSILDICSGFGYLVHHPHC